MGEGKEAHLEVWLVPLCGSLEGESVERGHLRRPDIHTVSLSVTGNDSPDHRLLGGRDVLYNQAAEGRKGGGREKV